MILSANNEIQALANDAANCIEAHDDSIVILTTEDGAKLTQHDMTTLVWFAQTDIETVFSSFDELSQHRAECGLPPVNGTDEVAECLPLWQWLEEVTA